MNLNIADGIALLDECLKKLPIENKTEIIFTPSFIHLYKAAEMCVGFNNVFAASQDCSINTKGSFTGEISADMIASCGAKYVILGHSERRANFNEKNEILKIKVNQAIQSNLEVIFCCGESFENRENNLHFEWIRSQITESLFHLSAKDFTKIIIAYEPVWAIGTGITASSSQAQEVHAFIREIITNEYGLLVANNTSILYGGSCNPSNAFELFSKEDIDGGLIGGASLNANYFIEIINSF